MADERTCGNCKHPKPSDKYPWAFVCNGIYVKPFELCDNWSIIRIGEVTGIDPVLCRVKVHFEEMEYTPPDWLPVIQIGAGNVKTYWLPAIGEQVVCGFYSDGTEEGVVIGSYYRDSTPPPASGANMRYIVFPDGSLVRWNNGVWQPRDEAEERVDDVVVEDITNG